MRIRIRNSLALIIVALCLFAGLSAAHADCSNPAGVEKDIAYNTSTTQFQYCDSTNWIAMHAPPGPAAPTGCSTVGDLCSDGSYYIGQVRGEDIYATSPASESTQTWNDGSANYVTTGFTDTVDGPGNTAGLVALGDAGSPYDAANYCDGLTNVHGHRDWYLPAKDELNLLYNGGVPVAGVLTDGTWYWSSTEGLSSSAWMQRFNDGSQINGGGKSVGLSVRCVRR